MSGIISTAPWPPTGFFFYESRMLSDTHMLLRKLDYLRCDKAVSFGIGMNAVFAQKAGIVALFEKCLADVDDRDIVGLADFPDGARVAFVPAVNELDIAQPGEDCGLIEACAREPCEVALGIERGQGHKHRLETILLQHLQDFAVHVGKTLRRGCRQMFPVRICRNFIPAKVAVIASELEEGETRLTRAGSAAVVCANMDSGIERGILGHDVCRRF